MSSRGWVLSSILTWVLLGALAPDAVGRAEAPRAPGGDTIKAVVVDSWSGCGSGGVIWDTLNANWSQFGSIPVTIDYSNLPLCAGPVTYDDLVASGADVVIISDPDVRPMSRAEGKAIHRYAMDGHNVIGTFLLFNWANVDNHHLAPLFGLRASTEYLQSEQHVTPVYRIRTPDIPLFRDVADPYVSTGYASSQVPSDGTWGGNDLKGAVIVGKNADSTAAIFLYRAEHYDAIYITTMPEFGGGSQDQQFFYNAIIYPQTGA